MTTIMERIVIIGVTGAGKTTLAFNVAARLGMPYTDLDDLYWRPGWQSAPEEEFRGDVAKAAAADRWVMTGNYLSARNVLWPRADTLVWLDYSFGTTFYRLSKRTLRHLLDGTTVCNGNRETLSNVFSRNGIIPWLFQTYGQRKRDYGAIFENPAAYPHLQKIRLRNQQDADQFVASLR